MDTEVLLLNPRGRARRKSAKGRKRNPGRSAAQRAATRKHRPFRAEPFLERWSPILRAVFSKWGLLLWCAAVVWGLFDVGSKWSQVFSNYNAVIDPSNLLTGAIVFLCLRAWHELGHAAACKALGGRCTEVGLIFMMLVLPFPYCDTSSAWRFPQGTSRRAAR